MLKRRSYILTFLGLILPIVIALAGISTAWFASRFKVDAHEFTGECIANYYADGNGSENDPFIITTPRHLYNMTWLQNENYLYGYPAGKTIFFKLGANIDMSTFEGAIPPIGNDTYPFIGFFDGEGYTISNLWVSTDPEDWVQKPLNYTERSFTGGVGFFGSVVKTADNTQPTMATSFYLKNVEITNSISSNAVGIVCGYIDGSLTNIGVQGGQIRMKKSGLNVNSDFTLIGYKSEYTIWHDVQSINGQGDLMVTPSDNTNNRMSSLFSTGSSPSLKSSPTQVPDSIEGNAYFYNTTRYVQLNSMLDLWYYQRQVSFESESFTNERTIIEYSQSDSDFTRNRDQTKISQNRFYSYYTSYSSSPHVLNFGAAPGFSAAITANNQSGKTRSISELTNCVWFKPESPGVCALSFFHTNNSSSDYLSIYRFKRTDTSITDVKEIAFELSKAMGNRNAAYYECLISKAEIDAGYEYAVGNSTRETRTGTDFGFFYMLLAGSDKAGGKEPDGYSKIVKRIEFVNDIVAFAAADGFGKDTYIFDQTVLSFSATSTSGDGTLCFHEFADGKVHYTSPVVGVTVHENVENGDKSILDNTSTYPTRSTS